jgi:hypothetical protein
MVVLLRTTFLEETEMRNQVISLYDFTGEALRPWAEAGYECFAYDIQHEGERTEGNITFVHADLYDGGTLLDILARHNNKACFMSAFPPCTDLASSGAKWWKKKAEANPDFQTEAVHNVARCRACGASLTASSTRAILVGICQRMMSIRHIQMSFLRGMRTANGHVFGRVAVSKCQLLFLLILRRLRISAAILRRAKNFLLSRLRRVASHSGRKTFAAQRREDLPRRFSWRITI